MSGLAISEAWFDGLGHRERGMLLCLLFAAEAGRLPGDEAVLCEAAGCGLLVDVWRRSARRVLRGWRDLGDGWIGFAPLLARGAAESSAAVSPAAENPVGDNPAAESPAALDRAERLREKWRRQARRRYWRGKAGEAEPDREGGQGARQGGDWGGELSPPGRGMGRRFGEPRAEIGAEIGAESRAEVAEKRAENPSEIQIHTETLSESSNLSAAREGGDDAGAESRARGAGDVGPGDVRAGDVGPGDVGALVALFHELRARRWPELPALPAVQQRRDADAVRGWLARGVPGDVIAAELRSGMAKLLRVAGSIRAIERSLLERWGERNAPRLPMMRAIAGGKAQPMGARHLHPSLTPWAEALHSMLGAAEIASWWAGLVMEPGRHGRLLAETRFKADWLNTNRAQVIEAVFGAGRRVEHAAAGRRTG